MRLCAHAFGGESASSRIHQPILPQTVQLLCAQAAAGKYSPVAREVVACSHRPYAVVVSSPPAVCMRVVREYNWMCRGNALSTLSGPSPATWQQRRIVHLLFVYHWRGHLLQ